MSASPRPTGRQAADPATHPNKSVARAVRLLASFTETAPEWSVSELARAHGLAKSSVSTLLTTLAAEDLVVRSPVTRRYRLGLRCLEMGYLASTGLLVRDLAFPFLEALHGDENHIVYLGIPYQGEVLYVEALYPLRRRINVSAQGRRAPLYCTGIGKALLAHLPEAERAAYLDRAPFPRLTPWTLTERDDLANEVASIRRHGHAVDRQEREEGIHCIATAVRDDEGHAVASVSVSAAADQLPEARFASMAARVTDAAREISRKVRHAGIVAVATERAR